MRSRSARITVPLPAPDGPVTTKTDFPGMPGKPRGMCQLRRRLPSLPRSGRLAVEEPNQLRALAIRQSTDRLRLADAALVEKAGGLHASELRNRYEHVEHLRREHVLRRLAEDGLDPNPPELQVLLEPGASEDRKSVV